MYVAIYEFETHPGKEKVFIESWNTLTRYIYQHMNSLGSRLHKSSDCIYLAYAQWPSKEVFEANNTELPPEMVAIRETMRNACVHVGRLVEMDTVDDFLQDKVYGGQDSDA